MNQWISVTLRILFFRAGPQDLPFWPQATVGVAAAAVGANYLAFVQAVPGWLSLLLGLIAVGTLVQITRAVLRGRGLESRSAQTLQALLGTTTLLTLALIPVTRELGPVLSQIAADPTLIEKPGAVVIPMGALWTALLLNIWNFAVTAFIFRHAVNLKMGGSLVLTLVLVLTVSLVVNIAGQVLAGLTGAG